jgi:hypothetical protein
MARTLREVVAAVPAERRAKIAAAHTQKLIAEEQKLIAEKRSGSWWKPSACWSLIAI